MINIQQIITNYLNTARYPALLCSWGRDSALLLYYARQVKRDLPVYYFGDELPELAAQMIVNDDLTVFSCAPVDTYLVPHGDELAQVDEYDFNGQRVPMISEVTRGTSCSHGAGPTRQSSFYLPHDTVLWGYRRADTNDLLPDVKFEQETQVAHTRFVAPLYDLTNEQVDEALDALGIPYVADSAVEFCNECLNAIIQSDWDRNAALAGFHARYNFNH